MLVTQGLVHQGYLAANPRFGSLPKVALAGILGFGLGKASYIRVCQSKFHSFEAYPVGEDRRACPDRKASPRGEFSRFLNFSCNISSYLSFRAAPAAHAIEKLFFPHLHPPPF
uniref:OCIA domain-containing protein n=1 Tax=Sus scrofa TaxID=9823 RepID=A0A8D1LCY0_PIG